MRIKATDTQGKNAIIETPFAVDGIRRSSLPQRMKLRAGNHRFVIEATDEYKGKAESRHIDDDDDIVFELERKP